MKNNRLYFCNGYIPLNEFEYDKKMNFSKKELENNLISISITALDKHELVGDILDRIGDANSAEMLSECDFLDELLDKGLTDDFIEYVFERPEFEDGAFAGSIDNLEFTEWEEDYKLQGYDYTCDIDIDLMPIYKEYVKARGIQSEFNHDKDKEEPEK